MFGHTAYSPYLERLPCVQIYKDGALVDTHNIGNKDEGAIWHLLKPKFEESFQHLQLGY